MKEILVAVDGHPHATEVVEAGIEFAQYMSAKILLVFVVKGKAPEGYKSSEGYDQDEYERTVEPFMESMRDAKVDFEPVQGEGDPKKFILKTAASRGVSMIVLGIHPRKNIGKLLALGDIARSVVESSKSPVLVVP